VQHYLKTFLKSFPLHISAYMAIIKCYNCCGAETAVLYFDVFLMRSYVRAVVSLGDGPLSLCVINVEVEKTWMHHSPVRLRGVVDNFTFTVESVLG
jgi:hypothetical protein